MDELKVLARLKESLGEKLEYARGLIAEYEETMDYASHCNLLGFAEGIEFALEEIGKSMKGKRTPKAKQKKKGKSKAAG
jgi:hypothetical protein